MNSVYLDYQATTPTDELVVKKMLPFFTKDFGNPHSISHVYGDKANQSIENARILVAESLGAKSSEIIFTSGATESNNLALKGAMNYRAKYDKRTELVIVCTEHKCVIEAANKAKIKMIFNTTALREGIRVSKYSQKMTKWRSRK